MRDIQKRLLLTILVTLVIVSGCSPAGKTLENIQINSEAMSAPASSVQKIEVYHFHGTNQCITCKTVGAYAEETINANFDEEVKAGKVVFSHVNYDLVDNKMLAMKYDVTGSSLWIGVYDSNGFHPEQNMDVWYKIDNKQAYVDYLTGILKKRLIGDFS